ncbi:hypothetical protein IWW36_004854, partial [Coemansia brasiliensis]
MSSIDPLSVPFLHSCERCRQKKRRCSGEKPACAWCRDHNIPCRYRRTLRFNKQLENMCPPSSIEALSVPIVLSDNQSRQALPQSAANPSNTSILPSRNGSLPHASEPPSTSGVPASRQASVSANDMLSADALARLFSVDMFPQTNQPAPDVLQVVNSYITPFFGSAPTMTPEYASLDNTEANVMANLGNVATERQRASPQEWMPVGFNDGQLQDVATEQLSQSFLDAEAMFTIDTDFAGHSSTDMFSMLAGSSEATPQVASALPLHMQGLTSNSLNPRLSASSGSGPADGRHQSISNSRAATVYAGIADTNSLLTDSKAGTLTSPDASSSGAQPAGLRRSNTDPYEYQKSSSSNSLKRKSPEAAQDGDSIMADDSIPHILKEYVAAIPGNPSAAVIYRIMRDSFKAPRMGMVSLNMELLWFMLHKSVLPRIVFYGHIASTIRFSVANFNVKSMVPPHIDESCYKLALEEVPLVKDCSAIWGAIALCMITRYEFQSSRYKEMTEH